MTAEQFHAALVGGLLRAAEALCEASPFLMCGLIVAAVFRRLVGHAGVRTLFGDDSRTGLLRAWAVGMLLPVDALGVLPVIRELRKAGLKGGTILAFALSAPLFNPLSLLYGLTLSDPAAVLAFAVGSLIVVTSAGLLWDRLFPGTVAVEDPPPAPVQQGAKRLAAVAVAGAREASGGAVPLVLIALAGPLLLGIVVPKGFLSTAVNGENPFAPLVTTAVAIPAYASPMAAMGTVGSMFQHGNSVGAAFAMLVLGAGTTLGLLAWAWRTYGLGRTAALLGAVAGVTLALSYGIDRPLRPAGAEEGGHTHAFDGYTAPFAATSPPADPWARAWTELVDGAEVHERYALVALAAFVLMGLALRVADRPGRVEAWLERPPAEDAEAQPIGRFDVALPAPVLGGVALVGLAAISVLGCFTYYPPPGECLDDLNVMQTEALIAANTGDAARAAEFIPVCEDWAKRAQVGYVLRNGPAGEFRELRTALYLDRLELLEHELAHQAAESKLDDPAEQAIRRELVGRIGRSFGRLRQAYDPDRN
ncbi:permease [Alienimonas californiensis]|uniref:Putative permease n=1 Tax=Alienimonas californiensis TaxID=2527989 RepID=A0A517P6N1_9PLAN|nr:permease [Alienimonas californiensis]QDT15029.1 putative permease [Alienimonas californiensis]